jgi:hypothetical protein
VLDILLLLVELRLLLPRGAEEEGKLLVGDHQRKEGRKKQKCVFWVLWVGLLVTSPHTQMAILTRGELLCVGECIGTTSRYNNCTSSRSCGIVSTTILGKGLCSSYYVPRRRRRRRRSLERVLGVRWCCKDDDDDDDGRGWTGGSGRGVGRKGSSVFVCFAQQSLYETLGVASSASEKEIRQAYRRMALKYHPDVNKKVNAYLSSVCQSCFFFLSDLIS